MPETPKDYDAELIARLRYEAEHDADLRSAICADMLDAADTIEELIAKPMASVWVLANADDGQLGLFTSKEAAEAVLHPSIVGSDVYSLEEVQLDSTRAQPGEVYGPVFCAAIDLETGQLEGLGPHPHYEFRSDSKPDDGFTIVYRHSGTARGTSVISYDSAFTAARRARDEHLASGKPTREPVELVQLVGDTTPILGYGGDYDPIEVRPGVGTVCVPACAPEGLRQLSFHRTNRRTPEGLAIFELATTGS